MKFNQLGARKAKNSNGFIYKDIYGFGAIPSFLSQKKSLYCTCLEERLLFYPGFLNSQESQNLGEIVKISREFSGTSFVQKDPRYYLKFNIATFFSLHLM